MSRPTEPQISFADWELLQQGIELEPVLQGISDFLDDHAEMVEAVRQDLERGLKKPGTGRTGLTPSQTLRSLILMRVKSWDYRELRERIADGFTLRRFTQFYCRSVPKHDAFHRTFHQLTPQTLKAVNDLVVKAAVDLGLEDGGRLRVDSTVVQTDIHHPTDNTLLWDVVRVITRLIGYLSKAAQQRFRGFHNRTRAARRRMQEIQRLTPKERQTTRQTKKYRQLIGIAEEVVKSARKVLERTRKTHRRDLLTDRRIGELRKEIEQFCKLGDRVIDQASRRVLQGEQVPKDGKDLFFVGNLLSLEHAAAGLIDHTVAQFAELLDLLAQFADAPVGEQVPAVRFPGALEYFPCRFHHLFGDADQLAVLLGLPCCLPLLGRQALDFLHPSPRGSRAIVKPAKTLLGGLAQVPDQTRDHAHHIP